jgi:hypothetical protein
VGAGSGGGGGAKKKQKKTTKNNKKQKNAKTGHHQVRTGALLCGLQPVIRLNQSGTSAVIHAIKPSGLDNEKYLIDFHTRRETCGVCRELHFGVQDLGLTLLRPTLS